MQQVECFLTTRVQEEERPCNKKNYYVFAKKMKGSNEILKLGNIYAKRDWGHAKDYVEMQWKIMQQKKPDDYVIATGHTYTVKQFIQKYAKF